VPFFQKDEAQLHYIFFAREALNSRSKKSGRKTAGLSRYFFETTDVPPAGFSARAQMECSTAFRVVGGLRGEGALTAGK
jgi:hypothetical protein